MGGGKAGRLEHQGTSGQWGMGACRPSGAALPEHAGLVAHGQWQVWAALLVTGGRVLPSCPPHSSRWHRTVGSSSLLVRRPESQAGRGLAQQWLKGGSSQARSDHLAADWLWGCLGAAGIPRPQPGAFRCPALLRVRSLTGLEGTLLTDGSVLG